MRIRPVRSIPKFFEGAPPVESIAKKDFDELKNLVGGLTKIVQLQTQQFQAFRQSTPPTVTPPKDDDDADDEPDVNSMDNKAFSTFLMKNVGKILETKLGEFNTKLDGGLKEVRNGRARDEIEKFRGDHKDLEDWGTEIAALSKQHPTLGIQQLYTLARTSDPDKAKTIDAKYVEKKDEPNPEDERLTLFGGYRPSTGKTAGADGKEPPKMTTSEALEKSWDEALSKFPALKSLGGDDNMD
jgi:hypothetical protein